VPAAAVIQERKALINKRRKGFVGEKRIKEKNHTKYV